MADGKGGGEDQHEDSSVGFELRDEEQGSCHAHPIQMRPFGQGLGVLHQLNPHSLRLLRHGLLHPFAGLHLVHGFLDVVIGPDFRYQRVMYQEAVLVHDIIRSTLPQLDLDDIFSSQDSIALELHRSLNGVMNQYGFLIHHALITKIWPNDHVKESMNEVEASKRMKEAMPEKAEAVRIKLVKDAEALAERAHLNGVGVARERREIARGMKDVTVESTPTGSHSSEAISSKGVMDLLLLTQYFDVLSDLSGHRGVKKGFPTATGPGQEDEHESGPSTSLFVTHMPETVAQLSATARKCFGSDTVQTENLLDL
eukprot:CAMPEP_0181126976 /NCGR_PEP_ID=MMETSP1071-20121207/27936_1 /TAXON_ID=35127 /ORGANISM="Thalassiosira sp., Strain NH16" /LENGTH=311 /DNA_ID=CAMNT_0023212653 /DNA_START=603 /DNA_END=1538 /DNA_ORIENTATION=-